MNIDDPDYQTYKTVKDYFTYEETMVEYLINIYAVDKGAPVRLGTLNQYRLKISASCIQNMEFVVGTDSGVFNVSLLLIIKIITISHCYVLCVCFFFVFFGCFISEIIQ